MASDTAEEPRTPHAEGRARNVPFLTMAPAKVTVNEAASQKMWTNRVIARTFPPALAFASILFAPLRGAPCSQPGVPSATSPLRFSGSAARTWGQTRRPQRRRARGGPQGSAGPRAQPRPCPRVADPAGSCCGHCGFATRNGPSEQPHVETADRWGASSHRAQPGPARVPSCRSG